jgi:hypothetical protein
MGRYTRSAKKYEDDEANRFVTAYQANFGKKSQTPGKGSSKNEQVSHSLTAENLRK